MNLTGQGIYQKAPKESDKAFLAWLRTKPCCVCKSHLNIQAAHVRLGGRGGIGMKPSFSAVPLCGGCHHIQHEKGHSSLMPTERWIELADYYLETWKGITRF